MKKIAVVYQSVHHSNTKKVLEHLREKFEFDLFDVKQAENVNFSAYDEVGLASGIYFGKLHSKVLEFFEKHFDELKKVFVIYTCGDGRKKQQAGGVVRSGGGYSRRGKRNPDEVRFAESDDAGTREADDSPYY